MSRKCPPLADRVIFTVHGPDRRAKQPARLLQQPQNECSKDSCRKFLAIDRPAHVRKSLTRTELICLPRIIHTMRLLLVALMITLLPVRAWLGDAMAMQMVAGHSNTIEIIATDADKKRAGGAFFLNLESPVQPCHDADATMDHASHITTPTDPADHSDCAKCSTCQVCHSVALSPAAHLLPLLALPTQLAHSSHALFASVPRAPHLKPPIS